MEQLVLEGSIELRDEFEKFAREHPEYGFVEVAKGYDGASIVSLVIERAPLVSASLAVLIATIQRRNVKVKATRDGVEVSLSDAAKAI